MADATLASFTNRWENDKAGDFQDNNFEKITEQTFRDFATDNRQLHARGPNKRASGPMAVIYLTQAEAVANGRDGVATLEALDPENLYYGVVARVDLHPDQYGQEMELVWSPTTTTLRAYIDGDCKPYPKVTATPDGKGSAMWIKKGSNRNGANVPLLDPKRKDYPAGFTVQARIGTKYYLFRTVAAGGPFPAPTDTAGTKDWQPVAEPMGSAQRAVEYELDYVQRVLLPYGYIEPGLLYLITGPWNQGDDNQQLCIHSVGPSKFMAYGTLYATGSPEAVLVDVLSGTTAPVGTGNGGPAIDAYTKAESDALRASLLDLLTAETAARQQGDADLAASLNARIAQVVGAAPAALDTLAELAAQLQADEQGTAAILATQQQHSQQINGLLGLGGRNRGSWAATTVYKQYDWVIQGGLTYYANADFTSGATFDATKWTPFGAGLTPTQVLALNPLTYPVMGLSVTGLKGYDTFEAAVAAREANITLNRSVTLTKNTSFIGTLRANGAELKIADGVTFRITNGTTLLGAQIYAAGTTGSVLVYGASATGGTVTALECPQLIDCYIGCGLRMTDTNGMGVAARGISQLDSLVGAGQIFLYDLSDYSAKDAGVIATDRRPTAFVSGGGGGATYTDEQAQDAFASLLAAGTHNGISFAYNDGANSLSATVTAAGGGGGGTTPSTGIDYANPVVLNAATALAINKAYTVKGAGYGLALPDAAANIGAVIFVLIDSQATGLYPLAGTAYSLYARESLAVRATANGWSKVGGELLALSARIETTLAQQDAINGTYKVPFSVIVTNSLNMADIANSRLVIPRDGIYTLGAAGVLKNVVLNGQYNFYFKATAPNGAVSYPAQSGPVTENNQYTAICNVVATAARYVAGTTIEACFYAGNMANLRGTNEGNQFFLAATETV